MASKDNYNSGGVVQKGLYTINSGELPIWVNNICQWLAWQNIVVKGQFKREEETQKKIDAMSWWQKLRHGFPRVNYAPHFFFDNPFPQPSAEDLAKFEKEYPDMAKEWGQPNER